MRLPPSHLASALLLMMAFPAAASDAERELAQLTTQRDKALADAAEPINRRYKQSLEQLLEKATKANDLEAAVKVRHIIATLENKQAVGEWVTAKGATMELTPGGSFRATWSGGTDEGRWKINENNEVIVDSKNGPTFIYRVSDDGKTIKRQSDGVVWTRKY